MAENAELVLIRRLLDAQTRVHVSRGKTPTFGIDINQDSYQFDSPPSNYVRFTGIEMRCTGVAGGATTVNWFLSRTATASASITPVYASPLVLNGLDPTIGSFAASLDLPYYQVAAIEGVYVIARTNLGTCVAVPYLFWLCNEYPTPLPSQVL